MFCLFAATSSSAVKVNVDWDSFLARSDPTWTETPTTWYEAPFVGNGKLGAWLKVANNGSNDDDDGGGVLQLKIGSTSIWDDRPKGPPFNVVPENFQCTSPRLPIGHFELDGVVVSPQSTTTMRMGLYNAEMTGSINGSSGTSVSWRAFAHAVYSEADVLAIELTQSASASAAPLPKWNFVPSSFNRLTWQSACKGLPPNQPPLDPIVAADGAVVVVQKHLRGTEHATAYLTVTDGGGGGTSVTYISTSDVLGEGESGAVALAAVRAAKTAGIDALTASHRKWWHAYYARTFLTLSNPQIESFYWIQLYKIASATRADRPVYDLMGPWDVNFTHWPDIHFDLNLQMTYQPMFTGNRLDLLESLTRNLQRTMGNLINNVPLAWRNDSAAAPANAASPDFKETCYNTGALFNGTCVIATGPGKKGISISQTGNLLWLMHLWHKAYVFKGYDPNELAALFPLLARAVTYYSHISTRNATKDEWLHLAPTKSPEYGSAPDANYDVSLLRWGLRALLDAVDVAALPAAVADSRVPLWREMSATLTPYPIDKATGLLIGDGMELAKGHRHFSHLFSLWPLQLLNLSAATDYALAAQSVDHWISLRNLHGFSYTAIVPMSIMLGRKSAVVSNFTLLLDTYITANTMYYEGKEWPCGETPPAAAAALMDTMLLEWNGVTRIFAGIDDASIPDAAFAGLLAPGGFEVAARREKNVTLFVQITNAADALAKRPSAKLALFVDAMALPWAADPASVRFAARTDGSGVVDIDLATLPKGASVVLYSAAAKPAKFEIVPSSSGDPKSYNYWGLPRGAN